MGCVVYYVLSGGSHPFGAPFLRQANIEAGNCTLSDLSGISKWKTTDCGCTTHNSYTLTFFVRSTYPEIIIYLYQVIVQQVVIFLIIRQCLCLKYVVLYFVCISMLDLNLLQSLFCWYEIPACIVFSAMYLWYAGSVNQCQFLNFEQQILSVKDFHMFVTNSNFSTGKFVAMDLVRSMISHNYLFR